MANSKNTIQNIPLEAELCMNALKTEVKPFKGYNEKNTTFYGGTLSPIYDKVTDLFDKDNSYTFFNSKGEAFTLVKEDNKIRLYKGHVPVNNIWGDTVSLTEKLDVSDDTFMAAKMPDGDILSVNNDGWLYVNSTRKVHFNLAYTDVSGSIPNAVMTDCQVSFYFYDGATYAIFAVSFHSDVATRTDPGSINFATVFYVLDNNKDLHRVKQSGTSNQLCLTAWANKLVPVVSFEHQNSDVKVYWTPPDRTKYYSHAQRALNSDLGIKIVTMGLTNYVAFSSSALIPNESAVNELWLNAENIDEPGLHNSIAIKDFTYIELARFAQRIVSYDYAYSSTSVHEEVGTSVGSSVDNYCFAVVENEDDIECPLGQFGGNSVYYLNGNLIGIGSCGRPIAPFLRFTSNIITPFYTESGSNADKFMISYKSGKNWYCYTRIPISKVNSDVPSYLKRLVVDNRYVFLPIADRHNLQNDCYDIESSLKFDNFRLDWVLSDPVCSTRVDTNPNGETQTVPLEVPETLGVVYCAGVNAGYMISNAELIGYLPNPYLGKVFDKPEQPPSSTPQPEQKYFIPSLRSSTLPNIVQYYWEVGDTAQAAVYKGSDPEYEGTPYPIDPNSNVALPLSVNAEIIKGYSNNDMVKEGNTVYPLMYWNNNQKTYSYMHLSSMENVTDVFSLQGQQYVVDNENIYAINFSSGVISNVNAVAYKKNLTFLGTLPTQAVFWSDFNKTFYAFTGDRTLSRMFEASDINKIHFVGQNPSSLSLWVCTDSGVYILSDSDMYKLDFESKQVAFQPKTALIVTEGETNNECHAISLYLKEGEEGEMIPVKLQTAYYGLGGEMKAVMDCWYIRLFDKDRTEGYVKVKVNTITDVTRHTEEKTFKVNPSDYDDNNIFYLRYQPKYQECVSMQLELETNLGIYSLALGVNTTDSTAQVSKFNF